MNKKQILKWIKGDLLYKELCETNIPNAIERIVELTINKSYNEGVKAKKIFDDISRCLDYAIKIQKEKLTEFMKGYWRGQEVVLKELKQKHGVENE